MSAADLLTASAKPTVASWLLTALFYGLIGPLFGVGFFLLVNDATFEKLSSWGDLARFATAVIGFLIGLIPGFFTGVVLGGLRRLALWIRLLAAPFIGAAVTFATGFVILDFNLHDAADTSLMQCGAVAALVCAVLIGAIEMMRAARTTRAA